MTLAPTFDTEINLFADIGLSPSVVQSSRGDDPGFLNMAWTFGIIRSAAVFMITFILARPEAVFYHNSRVVGIILALKHSIALF